MLIINTQPKWWVQFFFI